MEDEEKSGCVERGRDAEPRLHGAREKRERANGRCLSNKEQDNDNCVIGCVMPISTRPC